MAPSTKGANPAPNYTVMMNRVQTQIEAQLRTVRSFLPSKPPTPAQTTTTTSSFSALASTSRPTPSTATEAKLPVRRQNEENIFAESSGQDPNAGLGFGAISKRSSEKEKERGNQILRSRLLGRKRGAEDASGRTTRYRAGGEESSDDEAGRGGLGRAKKRARRDEPRQESEEKRIDSSIPELGASGSESDGAAIIQPKDDAPVDGSHENGNGNGNGKGNTIDDQVVSHQQKKRKKKKKKKDGSKLAGVI
ncbi:hypothetical protein GGR50DRAFT_516722 [Xylaria sp. CBS 124048]|nr:hypothetical protein GGR50DRAFT_516722 [Xylaria sp. CBS 124048]